MSESGRVIEVDEPLVEGQRVVFRWQVTPFAALAPAGEFSLRFPPTVDLARVPREVLWTAALSCLHMQFVLLRPCVVRLPVTLPPGHTETWLRLMDAAAWTLDDIRGRELPARSVVLEEAGAQLPLSRPLAPSDRCATAFSSGKDSLLQVGLLAELTEEPPLLVTVTSPLPPFVDHLNPHRRKILGEIVKRRRVELVEVESDLRGSLNNNYAADVGFPVGVNELNDTHLYFAALLIASVARGVPHLFMASEAEVQENDGRPGQVIQHPHFMYAAATQRGLAGLLQPLGIEYSSLTWPLYSVQVQQLLWTRYADLADLQYSCWLLAHGERFCSRCEQCMRLMLIGLAMDRPPGRVGLNFVRLMETLGDWAPDLATGGGQPLPARQRTGLILHRHIARSLRKTGPLRAARTLLRHEPHHLLRRRWWAALLRYAKMRYTVAGLDTGPLPGYRDGFLTGDTAIAEGLGRIFREAFPSEPESVYGPVLERSRRLGEWMAEPVAAAADERAQLMAAPPPISLPAATARAHPKPPRVSVIIPMMDRAADLVESLPSLLAQDYPAFEVLIIDMGSRDGLDGVLAKHGTDPRVLRVRRPRPQYFSFAAARNAGIRAAVGDLLLFWNGDHTFATRHGLSFAVDQLLLGQPEEVEAGWFARWRESCGYARLVPSAIQSWPPADALPRYAAASGSTLLVERALIESVGGYNEWLEDWGYEDTDLLARLELVGLARVELRGIHAGDRGEALRVANMRRKDRLQTWERNRRISDRTIEAIGAAAPTPRTQDPDEPTPWARPLPRTPLPPAVAADLEALLAEGAPV